MAGRVNVKAVRVSQVRAGLAAYLHEAGVAAWRPDSPFQAGERGIVDTESLPAFPDSVVAIGVYDVDDDLVLPNVEFAAQLRFRDPSRDGVDDFADDAFEALHGRHKFPAGTVLVQSCERVSSAPFGVDDNGRYERVDNYSFVLMRTN